jgi:predicted small secreted protein
MRKLIILLAATCAVAVAGCNTISGAGRDVSSAGKAVTSTAEDAKH